MSCVIYNEAGYDLAFAIRAAGLTKKDTRHNLFLVEEEALYTGKKWWMFGLKRPDCKEEEFCD
jgi:hypothetical protein